MKNIISFNDGHPSSGVEALDGHKIRPGRGQSFHQKFQEKINVQVERVLSKFKMSPLLVTFLDMWKLHLITKETAEKFSRGKIKAKNEEIIQCATDDLEKFFTMSMIRTEMTEETKTLYHITTLSESETKALKNPDNVLYLRSFLSNWLNKDPRKSLNEKEMEDFSSLHRSDSGKRVLKLFCRLEPRLEL